MPPLHAPNARWYLETTVTKLDHALAQHNATISALKDKLADEAKQQADVIEQIRQLQVLLRELTPEAQEPTNPASIS